MLELNKKEIEKLSDKDLDLLIRSLKDINENFRIALNNALNEEMNRKIKRNINSN